MKAVVLVILGFFAVSTIADDGNGNMNNNFGPGGYGQGPFGQGNGRGRGVPPPGLQGQGWPIPQRPAVPPQRGNPQPWLGPKTTPGNIPPGGPARKPAVLPPTKGSGQGTQGIPGSGNAAAAAAASSGTNGSGGSSSAAAASSSSGGNGFSGFSGQNEVTELLTLILSNLQQLLTGGDGNNVDLGNICNSIQGADWSQVVQTMQQYYTNLISYQQNFNQAEFLDTLTDTLQKASSGLSDLLANLGNGDGIQLRTGIFKLIDDVIADIVDLYFPNGDLTYVTSGAVKEGFGIWEPIKNSQRPDVKNGINLLLKYLKELSKLYNSQAGSPGKAGSVKPTKKPFTRSEKPWPVATKRTTTVKPTPSNKKLVPKTKRERIPANPYQVPQKTRPGPTQLNQFLTNLWTGQTKPSSRQEQQSPSEAQPELFPENTEPSRVVTKTGIRTPKPNRENTPKSNSRKAVAVNDNVSKSKASTASSTELSPEYEQTWYNYNQVNQPGYGNPGVQQSTYFTSNADMPEYYTIGNQPGYGYPGDGQPQNGDQNIDSVDEEPENGILNSVQPGYMSSGSYKPGSFNLIYGTPEYVGGLQPEENGGDGQPGDRLPGYEIAGGGQSDGGQPGEGLPGGEQPGSGQLGDGQPGDGQSVGGQPGSGQPVYTNSGNAPSQMSYGYSGGARMGYFEQPGGGQPDDRMPGYEITGGQPGFAQTDGGQPGGKQPGNEQPDGVQSGGGQPGGGQPGGEQSGGGWPVYTNSGNAPSQVSYGYSGGAQLGYFGQPGVGQSGGGQPGDVQPGGVQPGGEQPDGGQPGSGQPWNTIIGSNQSGDTRSSITQPGYPSSGYGQPRYTSSIQYSESTNTGNEPANPGYGRSGIYQPGLVGSNQYMISDSSSNSEQPRYVSSSDGQSGYSKAQSWSASSSNAATNTGALGYAENNYFNGNAYSGNGGYGGNINTASAAATTSESVGSNVVFVPKNENLLLSYAPWRLESGDNNFAYSETPANKQTVLGAGPWTFSEEIKLVGNIGGPVTLGSGNGGIMYSGTPRVENKYVGEMVEGGTGNVDSTASGSTYFIRNEPGAKRIPIGFPGKVISANLVKD